jgi:hypothetical protein
VVPLGPAGEERRGYFFIVHQTMRMRIASATVASTRKIQ